MKTLAARKAKANVVGLVGLVENMPSGNAVRPGDVVKSMKGDTIEVINTDAEGRLVLADVLWYAQQEYNPIGMMKSRVADMKNVGTRAAGSITAAQFLQRFVKDETPWCHLDIAGVASLKSESDFAPKGATGWGVRALNRLIADHFEGS